MIILKNLLLESLNTSISSKDVFNFYWLFTLQSYHPQLLQSDYGKFIQNEYLKSLQAKYIIIFKKLLYNQLRKYISQKRIDSNFPIEKLDAGVTLNATELASLMSKTFRSDLKQRNTAWNLVSEYLIKLETAQTSKDIYSAIDRLNNLTHNTGTQVLGKLSYDLIKAYDIVHHAKSLNDYAQFVDKNLRQLLDQTNESVEDELLGGKQITADTPKGFSPTPVFRDTSPKDDEDDDDSKSKEFDFPLEENNLKVSDSDRKNHVFMTGVKLALQDKKQGNTRNLKGYPEDFVRGYKTIPHDSWWDKTNNKLTQWVSSFGSSYGNRR